MILPVSDCPFNFPVAQSPELLCLSFCVPREQWTEPSPCRDENNLELTPIAKSSGAPLGEEIGFSVAFLCTLASKGPSACVSLCRLFAPFPEGGWEMEGKSVWYLRAGNGWEARYGPRNRAPQETCLQELCEHVTSSLGAHLPTSEPGGRSA